MDSVSAYMVAQRSLMNYEPAKEWQDQRQDHLRDLIRDSYEKSFDKNDLRSWCPVSGDWLLPDCLDVVPVIPLAFSSSIVDYICGAGYGSLLNELDNCLPFPKVLKEPLDLGDMAVVSKEMPDQPLTWTVSVLNEAVGKRIRKFYLDGEYSDHQFSVVDGKELKLRGTQRPNTLFLCFRFLLSVLHIKLYHPEYLENALQTLFNTPWPIKKPWFRKAFLLRYMERVAGTDEARMKELTTLFGINDEQDQDEDSLFDNEQEGHAVSLVVMKRVITVICYAQSQAEFHWCDPSTWFDPLPGWD